MDLIDDAQKQIEQELDRSLSAAKAVEVEPSEYCISCDVFIPEARRQAVKTNVCVDCAAIAEAKAKHFR